MQILQHISPGSTSGKDEKLILEKAPSRSEPAASEAFKKGFKSDTERYGKLQNEPHGFQSTKAQNEKESRRGVLNTYLERRLFNAEFPDDARRLQTYKIYNSTGRQLNFSFSSLEFVGNNVDAIV